MVQILFYGIIIFSVWNTQSVYCKNFFEDELNQHLKGLAPLMQEGDVLKKEFELVNKKIAELNSQLHKWTNGVFPLITDIIKSQKIDSESKVALLQRFFNETRTSPNDIMMSFLYRSDLAYSTKVDKSLFSFVVSHILEEDSHNCPLDLIQGLMAMGGKPGSDKEIDISYLPYDFFNRKEQHDAHFVVKKALQDQKSETCMRCAQKIDDLFNEYIKSEKNKN